MPPRRLLSFAAAGPVAATLRRAGGLIRGCDRERFAPPAPQRCDHDPEVGRQRQFEAHPLAGGGMHEGKHGGVEGEARDFDRVAGGLAVHEVAEHRMIEEGEVDANLMGAARAEFGLDQGDRTEPLDRAKNGLGGPTAAAGSERSAARAGAGSADRAGYVHRCGEVAAGESEVAPVDGVGAELLLENFGGVVVERDDHDSGGVAVEAMDHEDATVGAGPLLDCGSDAGNDGVVFGFRGGMDDQAGRLHDDSEIVVNVEDLDGPQRNGPNAALEVDVDRDPIGCRDERTGIDADHPVDQDVADLDRVPCPRIRAALQFLDGASETDDGYVHSGRVAFTGRRRRRGRPKPGLSPRCGREVVWGRGAESRLAASAGKRSVGRLDILPSLALACRHGRRTAFGGCSSRSWAPRWARDRMFGAGLAG